MSEPPIHVVSPQPADFYAAALPHCFVLHTVNLFKSGGVFFLPNGEKFTPEILGNQQERSAFQLQLRPFTNI